MYPIKQSTAITIPFFVHDVAGDAVPGLVDAGFTKRISKGSGAFAAMTVTITEMENGWYSFPLSTAHSNTLGLLTILFTHASSKQINLQFRVEARTLDDLSYPTVSGRSVDVAAGGEVGVDLGNVAGVLSNANVGWVDGSDRVDVGSWLGTAAATPTVAGVPEVDITHLGGVAQSLLDLKDFADAGYDPAVNKVEGVKLVDTTTTNTDMVSEPPTGSAIADAIWDELQADHVTVGSFGEIATEIAAILLDTNELQTDDIPGLIAALNDPSAAAIADAIWDEAKSGHVGAGSFGEEVQAHALSSEISGLNDPSAATIADSVWDELLSGHVAVGSAGERVGRIPNAAAGGNGGLPTVDASNRVAGIVGTKNTLDALNDVSAADVNTQVDVALDSAIPGSPTANSINERVKAIDDKLPVGSIGDATASKQTDIETDTQDIQSRLPAALVTGRMSSDAVAISGSTDAADRLEGSAETIVIGAAIAGTLSTTQMTTNLTEASDDHFNGRILIWTSGALKDQATDITDYDGASKMLTYTATTEAPVATDTFVIV